MFSRLKKHFGYRGKGWSRKECAAEERGEILVEKAKEFSKWFFCLFMNLVQGIRSFEKHITLCCRLLNPYFFENTKVQILSNRHVFLKRVYTAPKRYSVEICDVLTTILTLTVAAQFVLLQPLHIHPI